MATVFKSSERKFEANPGRIDDFRLMSDVSITDKNLQTRNLNFDIRRLEPDQFSLTYHFHRNSEELFMIIAGSVTLRTPEGLEVLEAGDLAFFEMGEAGAHQLYNHTVEPCVYLDIRTFMGFDAAEYPDSGKVLLVPSMETFKKGSAAGYFEGEENVRKVWGDLNR